MRRAFVAACAAAFAVGGAAAQPAATTPAAPPAASEPPPAAPPASAVTPPVADQTKPLDLSSYSCQDMARDTADKNLERIGVAFVLSWALAQEKADPEHPVFDLSQMTQLSRAAGRVCAASDNRSRILAAVVAEQLGVLNGAK